jgi:phosphoglycolate phosphatase-like HAD superfamily hydrolase
LGHAGQLEYRLAAPVAAYHIDDTPLDNAAAHGRGPRAIAVVTEHNDSATLRETSANHVLETLEEDLPLAMRGAP